MTDKKRPGDQGNEEDFRIEYKPADDGVPQLDRKTFAKSRNAVVAEWSSKGRKNYVTGFRKRKLERQQVGRAQADAKKRKERSDLRKERNRAIYGDLAALQKEWDQEAAAAPETNHRATSQTTETTEMTFGDGAVATTVSIESFDMEETEVDHIVGMAKAPTLTAKAKRSGFNGGDSALVARASAHGGERKAGTMKQRKRDAAALKKVTDGKALRNAMAPAKVEEDSSEEEEEREERPAWWKKPRSERSENRTVSQKKKQKWYASRIKIRKTNKGKPNIKGKKGKNKASGSGKQQG